MPNWTKEQQEAIDKEGTNIIVSAGAGSGKTAVLSERVLRKIKNGISINELLILTFTNAAASEMKERIRKKLLDDNLLEEANNVDSAYITTFDSYALSIVKKYHYLFNISRNIKIIDSNVINLKKEEIINQIFEEMYTKKETKFLKLIDDFCSKDDTEIRNSIIDISNKLDLRYDKEEYLNNYVETYYNNLDYLVLKYQSLLITKTKEIKNKIKELTYLIDNDYINKLKEVLVPLMEAKDYLSIKNSLDIKLPQLPRGSEEEVKAKKEEINNLVKELKKMTKYETEKEIKENLLLTKDYAEIICQIIIEFTSRLDKYKYENNQFEFIDISKMAIKVVKENKNIQEELKNSYNEILLDEYQDTNDLQEEFIKLIENNNVYMVGDIKQSIYRFRNANPYIFKEKYDNYSKNNNGYKIDLNKNFRSRREVLNNINLIFNYIMDDNIGSANYEKEHQMIFGNKAYEEKGKTNQNNDFEILTYEYDKNEGYSKSEIEIFMIAKDIKDKIENKYQIYDKDKEIKRNITYEDFVILMDRATNFDLYKKIFEYLEIPLTIYKDENINNKNDLNIIKNIINLILKRQANVIDEEYKYYFMSIARSYLFRMNDQQIFKCIKENKYEETDLIKKIDEIKELIDQLSLKQIIKKIIDNFKFYDKLITVGDVEKSIIGLEYILNLSSNLESLGYDLQKFSEYLNDIAQKKYNVTYSLNTNSENSVKIMTIHKSKGLEYHICYYSGLYVSFNKSDIKQKFTYDNKYGIILPIFQNGIDTTIVPTLMKEKYLKEEISEKIRLFYVALTRAKEKMILILPKSSKEKYLETNLVDDYIRLKYTSFSDVLNSISNILEPYKKLIDVNSLNLTKNYNFIKQRKQENKTSITDNQLNKIKENVNIITKKQEHFSKKTLNLHTKSEYENMLYGRRIHEKFEYDEDMEKNLLQKYFNQERVKKTYHEFEFMYEEDNIKYHGIIDLILELENKIIIIDYKLKNIQDEKYLLQLEGYKKYLKMISNKKIEIYLYSIKEEKLQKIE